LIFGHHLVGAPVTSNVRPQKTSADSAATTVRLPALTLAAAASLLGCAQMTGPNVGYLFNEAEIRDAERALVKALESDDPTAWVYHYTEDAVFVAPGAPAEQGRETLLQMARSMKPLSSVSFTALRTEGSGHLAYVYGHGSWVNGRPPNVGATTNVRFLIIWRKEADGRWRVAQELLNTEQQKK